MKRFLLTFSAIVLFATTVFAGGNTTNATAPTFSGKTAEGLLINFADYKGKVVLLNFWTSGCGPCREDFPFLMKLHEKAKKGAFTVIAINVDADAAKMKEFLFEQKKQPSFPIIADEQGKIPALFDLKGMPTTILIDKKNVIRYRHTSFTEKEKESLIAEVKALLVE